MRLNSVVVAMAAGPWVASCSIYPLSNDRTGYDTSDIIQQFRCDLSSAVRRTAISYLRGLRDKPAYPGYTGEEIAYELENGIKPFEFFEIDRFYREPKSVLKYYKQARVGYDFTLQAIEDNTQSAGFSGVRNINKRVDTLGSLATNQITRDVSRNFRLQDDFLVLSRNTTFQFCDGLNKINIEFPTAGHLPLDNLVRNFLHANEQQNLQGDDKSPAIPKMADTIVFTTKLTANFDPSFALAPLGPGFLLSGATFKFDNLTTDKHTVIVAITVPPRKLINTAKGVVGVEPPGQERINDVNSALNEQRERNVQNAIIQIGNSITRLPF